MKKSFHAGTFFGAIGEDFSTLERSTQIINADVLDAWFDPSPKVLNKINEFLPFIIRTSPPNYSEGLIQTISSLRSVPEENILVGGGSSDIIFIFFQRMIGKNTKILILDPMYGEYSHVLENVINANVFRHKLKKEEEFQIDVTSLVNDIIKFAPEIVILVNPNSPTGKYLPREDIHLLLNSIPKQITVVIDETYIEYIGKENSLEKDIKEFNNLVIIKSMSKVYALSGARIGYIVADSTIIEELSTFLPPWAVSLMGQIAAVEALKDEVYYRNKYEATHILRKEIIENLKTIPLLKVYDSQTNFYLLELLDDHLNAETIYTELVKENIYIRNPDSMSTQFRGKFLRVAVKQKEANEKILRALKKICLDTV